MKRHRIRAGLPVVLLAMFLAGCPQVFLDKLNNPVDPDAPGYQGYDTIEDVNAVKPYVPDGAKLIFPVFTISKVVGADAYRLQIATDNIFNNVIFSQDGFESHMMAPRADMEAGDIYYWRGAARKNGVWGSWTDPRAFTMTDILVGASPANGASTTNTRPTLWTSPDFVDTL
jgi:hypothetical protein